MSKYILTLRDNNKKLEVKVNGKKHYIYTDNQREIYFPPSDDFRIKEKLYILNHPLNVVWKEISDIEYDFLRVFHSFIKPRQLVIKPINGKVIVDVNMIS